MEEQTILHHLGGGKGRCHAAHLYKAGVSAEEKDYQ